MAAWTEAQYQKLCAAIASGILRVRYDTNNEVMYQSTADMLLVKSQMERALNLDAAGNPIGSTTRFDRSVGVYSSGR